MSSEALAWLTTEFAEKILKKSESDESIEVEDLTTTPAVEKGENYASELIRASVKYSHNNKSGCRIMETISLVVKIAPLVEGANKELVRKFECFESEISMMQTTLAEMKDILNEKDYCLSARLLYGEIGDPSFIVMEDLIPLGYRMANRMVGLDLEHCLLVMRNLAKFHASSVALCEKDPQIKTMYKKGIFHADYPEDWKQYCISGFRSLGKELLNWPELGSDQRSYSEKLLKLSAVSYEKALECVNHKGSEFNVLNHGDMWVNNMLFRYDDEGKLTDSIFIDFQLSLWNSPAIDILNFLSTSLAEDVDLHHRETLLKEYLDTLTKTMSNLHCKTKPPTMGALEKTLRDYEVYDLICSCLFLPLVLLDKSESVNFDELLVDDQNITPAMKGQAFRKRMLRRIPAWDACGLFNI